MSIKKNGFVFVTPVWGTYINTFLNICIPSLLADGNLPTINVPAIFLIYTTKEDSLVLEQSQTFTQLKKIIKTEIHLITIPLHDSYRVITWCHQLGFDYADHIDAGIFIIMPDFVVANNYCEHLQKLALDGARLISVPNFSINLEDSTLELLPYCDTNNVLTIDAPTLMQIGMRNLNYMTRAQIWDNGPEYFLPVKILLKVENNGGFLGRYFYGCFNYIHPTQKFTKLHATMDLDYIFHACPDESLHYACTNSDDALVLEMSSKDRYCTGFRKGCIDHIRYYVSHLNNFQINHSKHIFKLSTGLASAQDWESALQKLNGLFDQIFSKSWEHEY